ncbi:MAG TPA: holo-ACP synthase [Anaerolineaceae bacterium]|nr:holo-ACP synthase [Anaerolineaceae bacterium]HQJ31775.1 holo-ACP synthase [Anaerolineaceae bacterium]
MIKCGIDLLRISRLADVNPAIRARFMRRVYTETELAQAQGENDMLSGIFTAKEAVSKALGTGIGKVAWQDIEILHAPSGEPSVFLHGVALEVAQAKGLDEWAVSITHEGGMAAAVAVAKSARDE